MGQMEAPSSWKIVQGPCADVGDVEVVRIVYRSSFRK